MKDSADVMIRPESAVGGTDGISYFTCTVFPVRRAASRCGIQKVGASDAHRKAGGRDSGAWSVQSSAFEAARLVIAMTGRSSITSMTPIIKSVELKKLWSVVSLWRSAAVRAATSASNSSRAYFCVVYQMIVAVIQQARTTNNRLNRPS